MEKLCKKCEGTGTVSVYRSDIENFDEITCPDCHVKGILSEKE